MDRRTAWAAGTEAAIEALRGMGKRWRGDGDPDYRRIVADPRGESVRHLEEAIALAVRDVPFYGAVHAPGKSLPILDREMIRARGEQLVSTRHREMGPLRILAPSDPTGATLRFLQDGEHDRFVGYALDYWLREIVGIDPVGLRTFVIWGSASGLLVWSAATRRKRGTGTGVAAENAFQLEGGDVAACLAAIHAAKPDVIRAYGRSLLELAMHLRDEPDGVPAPLFLVASAGTLTTEAREVVQDVFERPVYMLYGSRECPVMAGECRGGRLHVFDFNHHLEVVGPGGEPVPEGGDGRVLVSQLHNRVMPLLRYEIGDIGVPGPVTCGCGAPERTLLHVRNRISDPFAAIEGGIAHGEYITGLPALGTLAKAIQVTQEAPGDVRLLLVPHDGMRVLPGHEREIRQTIRAAAGKGCQVSIDQAPEVPLTAGRRLLHTLSRIRGGGSSS